MSFLGTLARGALGFVTGGPAGAAVGLASGLRGKAPNIPRVQIDSVIRQSESYGFGAVKRSRESIYTQPQIPLPGGYDNVPMPTADLGPLTSCPTGYRLNKTSYVTRGGGTSRWPMGLQLHEKRTVCVRRRRLNAGNGAAARHAVRRLVAFYRLSNRVAKQLRKAAARAGIRGRRTGRRALQPGRNVEVVNVE